MTTAFKSYFFTLFFSVIASLTVSAQIAKEGAMVEITGEVTKPFVITLSSLKEFKQSIVGRKDKEGKEHTYRGVELQELLQKAGVTLGKELRGKNLSKYVLAQGSDGYQVVFTLAELDSSFTDRKIILTDNVDGHMLPANEGPFRIIVSDEKLPARSVRQLTSLVLKFAK